MFKLRLLACVATATLIAVTVAGRDTSTNVAGRRLVSTTLVINEIDYDQIGTDSAEFVELYNVGSVGVSISSWELLMINGNAGGALLYDTIVLPAVTIPVGGYYVICANAATVPNCDLDDGPNTDWAQNGSPDAVGLWDDGNTLIDAVSYEGNSGAPYTEGTGVPVAAADSNAIGNIGLSRFPNGTDTDNNSADISLRCISPGQPNLSTTTGCAAASTNTPTSAATNTATSTPSNTPTNTPADTATNTPTNTPSNTPTNTPTNTPSNTPTNTPTNAPLAADIALTAKVDTPDPVVAGTNLTWVINGINNGPGTANGVTVADTLPAGVTLVSAVPSAGSCSGTTTVTCVIGTVGNGGTFSVTIVVTVAASAANGSTILNTATVTASTTDSNPGNNNASSSTTVSTQADLSTTKTDSPDPVIAGNNLTYSIVTTNNGPSDVQNVTLTDPLPAGTTFVSASASSGGVLTTPSVGSGGTVSSVWSGATAPTVQRTLSITVRVLPSVASGSVLTNVATATSTTADPAPTNNAATVTTTVNTQADVAVTKNDVPDPVLAGNNLTYTIVATNSGPSDAQTVALADTVPANTTFFSATPSAGGICTTPAVGGTGLVSCSWAGATIPAGTRTLTLVVRVVPGTPLGTVLSNTATTSSATADVVPANNSATATTTVSTQADLLTVKIDTPDPVIAGNNVTYNITITNNGPSDAQNIAVSDLLPVGTTFVSATPSAGASCSLPSVGGTGTVSCSWAGGTAPLGTRTLALVVRVLPSVASGTVLSNTATATTTTLDPNTLNNSATTTTSVITQADLAATKTDSPDPAISGNNVTYVVNSVNNGPSDAQTVVIADTIPTTTRFLSATSSAGGSCTVPAVNGSGTVSCSWAGATVPTAVRSVTIVVRICADVLCNALVSNTGSTSSGTTDPNVANNAAVATTTAQSQADTAITLSDAPDPVIAGQDVTYTSVVSNNGPSNAANTVATYTLDSRLVFVSAAVAPAGPTCSAAGQVVTCTLGVVGAANQCATAFATNYTVTIVATVPDTTACSPAVCPGSPGVPLSSSAAVTNGNCLADPVPGNNTAAQSSDVRAGADVVVDVPILTHLVGSLNAQAAAVSNDAGEVVRDGTTRATDFDAVFDAALAPQQDNADCVAVGDHIVVQQTFGNTGPLAFTRQRDNAGPEWVAVLSGAVTGQACRVTAGGGVCTASATQMSWNGEIPVGGSVTVEYAVRILGAIPTGTVLPFSGTVNYDGFNIGQNTFSRTSGVAEIALDCPSIIDPNTQLSNQVHVPILNYLGQDDVCDTMVEIQNIGCTVAKAALISWGEPGFCPPQAAGPLKVECTGTLKPGSSWIMIGAQVPTGSKGGIVFKFSGRQLTEDGIDVIPEDDVTADYMCEVLFFSVVGDADDYRRFKKAYDEGLTFDGVDLSLAVPSDGGLAVDVHRTCPGDQTPGVDVTSKYNGVAGTHLGVYDEVYGGYAFYVPLVYAQKAGYNSILYIQNSGLTCSSLEIWFQQQEDCLRATICDIATLAPGETYQLDASDCVGPDFQGSAWIRSTQRMAIAVDLIGHDLLMTYVGEPAEINYTFDPRKAAYTGGNQVGFAPLVYSEYQGWDSAIQVQNLSPVVAAKVKVYFLDRGGDIVTTLVDWVCPRGSQTFFLPLVSALPGMWVGTARVESQEWFAPGSPNVLSPNVVSVATLIEYADTARTTATQAMAYNLLPEHKIFDWQIGERSGGDFEAGVGLVAIPSLIKDLGRTGITSELAIANVVPKPGFTDLVIYVYDQNGLIDYICQKLNEKQVEYIDLQTWGWLNNGFKGSAVISAWFWEHDVFDGTGLFLRNLVGLGAMSIERKGARMGEDVPGDEAAGDRGIPFENTFGADGTALFEYCFMGPLPLCPGFVDARPVACEVPAESFACANCPVTIPTFGQAPPAVVNAVGRANCVVADVNITLDIQHSWNSDMVIDVSSPAVPNVRLANQICGADDNVQAILDSDAATPLGSVCPPAGFQRFTPGGVGTAPGALDAFDGRNPTGGWVLSVNDLVGGDGGVVRDWAVEITYR